MRLHSDTEFKTRLVPADKALPGRIQAIPTAQHHTVFSVPLKEHAPDGKEEIFLAMGCFWGAERIFWTLEGVINTAVGYAGGLTPNPTYEEVCSGRTGHTEIVRIVFDPTKISLDNLLNVFWEGHDPSQGMRQGNDIGTQYRSAIYWTRESQSQVVLASAELYKMALKKAGHGDLTTEMRAAGPFYYAEDYHQQYLHKNPNGYCGLSGTGVTCPIGPSVGTE